MVGTTRAMLWTEILKDRGIFDKHFERLVSAHPIARPAGPGGSRRFFGRPSASNLSKRCSRSQARAARGKRRSFDSTVQARYVHLGNVLGVGRVGRNRQMRRSHRLPTHRVFAPRAGVGYVSLAASLEAVVV